MIGHRLSRLANANTQRLLIAYSLLGLAYSLLELAYSLLGLGYSLLGLGYDLLRARLQPVAG